MTQHIPETDSAIGTEIDGFRITGVLGRGGMGVVYEAEDVALGRTVALKMIDPSFARDEHFLRRFQAEARALARINEPHIVQVYALRHTPAGSFIVMECVDGGTLGDRMNDGPVPIHEARPIIRQMLEGFGHAHDLGVIHRDIKPGNIMLARDGTVKITDFGLARIQQSQPTVTVTQAIAGTLYYMSPEQIRAQANLDHRSDLYAIGMTIYEMLTGRLPFERNQGEFQTMRAIVDERFPPPDRFNSAIPSAVSRVILRALEKDPDKRYQTAAEMLADFELAMRGGDETVPVIAPPTRDAGPDRRKWLVPVLALVGVVAVALVAFIILSDRAPTQAQSTPAGGEVRPALLSVTTDPPGATLSVNGMILGTTPASEEVQPQDARVHLLLFLDGHETVDTTLALSPGGTLPFHVSMRREEADPAADQQASAGTTVTPAAMGTLRLEMNGNGTVRAAGQSFDRPTAIQLSAGRHTVQCGSPPYHVSTPINVQANGSHLVTCHFDARISLNTQTEDGGLAPSAAIWIDGQDTGLFTPREIIRGPGSYRITVRKFGYEVLDEEEVIVRPSFEPPEVMRLVFRLRETG